MTRAYSLLTVKAVNESKRVIRGVATTPGVDRVGDIVEPLGVSFKNPLPLLWQHQHDKPIGTVKFETPTKDGINFEAELPEIVEDGTLRDRIEEAWQSIKAGLVRAVSIGFRPIEYAFMDEGGIRFIKSEVYELSAVTIPANAQALITGVKSLTAQTVASIKSFDTNAPAATGEIERPKKAAPGASGKSTPVDLRPKEGTEMKTIAEQIAALEATRQAKAARMAAVMQKSIDESRSTDPAEQEEFDTLSQEVEAIDGDIKRLKSLQKAQMTTATPVVGTTTEQGAVSRSPALAEVKLQRKTEPGIGFARIAKSLGMAKGSLGDALRIAEARYGADSDTAGVFKAAVTAGSTLSGSWAEDLVGDTTSAFADFVEYLRPQTILGKFGADGIPNLRRVPFRVPLVSQTAGGEGYWVGEGQAKPLTAFDFSRTTMEPLKVANIAVLTEEVIRDSSPSAEAIVRDALRDALVARLDVDFINPAKAAVAGVSPASITNGSTDDIASSGTDADAIRLDVRYVFARFIAANNAPSSGVWIMSATNALALSMMVNPLGQSEFPGISMTGGRFQGLPVIVSEYVGNVIILVNANDIYLADEGGIAIDLSREASLQMDTAPTMNSTTPTPTTSVSMFQTNSVAFRAERTINWARRRATSVAYLTGVAYGGAVTAPTA